MKADNVQMQVLVSYCSLGTPPCFQDGSLLLYLTAQKESNTASLHDRRAGRGRQESEASPTKTLVITIGTELSQNKNIPKALDFIPITLSLAFQCMSFRRTHIQTIPALCVMLSCFIPNMSHDWDILIYVEALKLACQVAFPVKDLSCENSVNIIHPSLPTLYPEIWRLTEIQMCS